MDFQAIKNAIDLGTESGRIMALVVVSSYRTGEKICLHDLDHLDSRNFELAIQVMSYRRMRGWNDEEFWRLERHAAHRLGWGG